MAVSGIIPLPMDGLTLFFTFLFQAMLSSFFISFYLLFCVCVYVHMCVRACMCVDVRSCEDASRGAKGGCQAPCSIPLHFMLLRQDLFLNLESDCPATLPTLHPQMGAKQSPHWGTAAHLATPAFYKGPGTQTPVLMLRQKALLSTEPSLRPQQ